MLDLVRRTAGEERNAVRVRLLELFDVVGAEDPRVVAARGALMRALF
ncbi:tetratricopeptide repeat protein [Kocuria sp.]